MIIRRTNCQKNKEITYDTVVVGGGIAGVSAAASAAKNGSKTLLIESATFLGGVVTMGPLEALMTQYDADRKVIGGIADELLELIKAQDRQAENVDDTTGYCNKIIPYQSECMKYAMLCLLDKYQVDLMMETMLVEANTKNQVLVSIEIQTKRERLTVYAKSFVDCSGSGILGYYSGCDILFGDENGVSQPVTVLTKWGNINKEQLREYVRTHMDEFTSFNNELDVEAEFLHLWGFGKTLTEGYETGKLSLKREEMHLMESTVPGEVILNFSRMGANPYDAFEMSKAQLDGSRQVYELFQYFREKIPAFKNAKIVQNGYVGVRESGRVKGKYVLTRQDIISEEKCKDSVAIGAFPMDIHQQGSGMKYERVLRGYGIPACALWSEHIKNLFMGGRCISSTFEANASCRISITCMATGQAAGVMASEYQEGINEEVLIRNSRDILVSQNAII